MATQSGFVWDDDFIAAADYSSTGQYTFVKLSGNIVNNTPEVVKCSATSDDAIGILQNKPKSGQAALVRILGRSKLVVNGSGTAISVGDPLGPNTSGLGVKKATTANVILGRALQASTGSADVISVELFPWSRYVASV